VQDKNIRAHFSATPGFNRVLLRREGLMLDYVSLDANIFVLHPKCGFFIETRISIV